MAIGTIEVEGGDARFVDRTIDPAYSEEVTGLHITVTGRRRPPGRAAA
ncbi:MAG TPA: DUF748 domain-containing protein [Candidatus Tectomicrobia bacterium]|nr:DUF748 domain-containing protein [Candidatus Tectomicrobia bacterium]